ncbi:hypothetical protein P6709_19965, partial [Jeotgalibacillus sp. ET6]|uniref:hypothetical protein n=1 Tax=Jeotgalibacillus sp. ET6 TaxID=3037260 RepID=UPI0024189A05
AICVCAIAHRYIFRYRVRTTDNNDFVWFQMLSGLIVIEYLFVIQGFTMILYRANDRMKKGASLFR